MNQEKLRNEITTKLRTIQDATDNKTWQGWLQQTIEFIREQR